MYTESCLAVRRIFRLLQRFIVLLYIASLFKRSASASTAVPFTEAFSSTKRTDPAGSSASEPPLVVEGGEPAVFTRDMVGKVCFCNTSDVRDDDESKFSAPGNLESTTVPPTTKLPSNETRNTVVVTSSNPIAVDGVTLFSGQVGRTEALHASPEPKRDLSADIFVPIPQQPLRNDTFPAQGTSPVGYMGSAIEGATRAMPVTESIPQKKPVISTIVSSSIGEKVSHSSEKSVSQLEHSVRLAVNKSAGHSRRASEGCRCLSKGPRYPDTMHEMVVSLNAGSILDKGPVSGEMISTWRISARNVRYENNFGALPYEISHKNAHFLYSYRYGKRVGYQFKLGLKYAEAFHTLRLAWAEFYEDECAKGSKLLDVRINGRLYPGLRELDALGRAGGCGLALVAEVGFMPTEDGTVEIEFISAGSDKESRSAYINLIQVFRHTALQTVKRW